MKLKRVKDQVVVIVGATSGIGLAAAVRLAHNGAKLVLSGRSQEALDQILERVQREGGEVITYPAEVTDFSQLKALADKAVETYGRIDSWVHTAAVSVYARFEDTEPEEFKQVIDVNLTGMAFGALAALPYLKQEGGGSLVLLSSVEGRRAVPNHSAYAASKRGINGFADALRMEMKEENEPINVAVIMPASINTPFYGKSKTKLGVKPRPVPPVYEPEVVAEAIHYALEHPVRELFAGGAGKAFGLTQRLSPALAGKIMMGLADTQKTDQEKSEYAPSNLFSHIEGYNRIHGAFSDEARSISVYNRLKAQPLVQAALGIAAAGAAAVLTSRVVGSILKARG